MTKRTAVAIILLLSVFPTFADESDMEKLPASWNGTAHIKGNSLTIIATNNSDDCAYIRIGALSDIPVVSRSEDRMAPPRIRLNCLYALSDYTVKILWPVKKDPKLVKGNEMMRLEARSESICEMVRKHNIQDIELVLSVIDLPLIEGVVKARDQIVNCRVRIEDTKK